MVADMTLVGVRTLMSGPEKRDLLLCDRLAIPELERAINAAQDPARRADLEWLAATGVVFDVPFLDTMDRLAIDDPQSHALCAVSVSALMMAMGAAFDSTTSPPTVPLERLSRIGTLGFLTYPTRAFALHLQRTMAVRAVPILGMSVYDKTWDVTLDLKRRGRQLIEDARAVHPSFVAGASTFKSDDMEWLQSMPQVFLRQWRILTAGDYLGSEDSSDVAHVVLRNFPVPSDATPISDVLDFTRNEGVRADAERLRR